MSANFPDIPFFCRHPFLPIWPFPRVLMSGNADNSIGTRKYKTIYNTSLNCLLGPLKCFNLLKVDTYFAGPSANASLSWQVSSIVGQTNTLSDPTYSPCGSWQCDLLGHWSLLWVDVVSLRKRSDFWFSVSRYLITTSIETLGHSGIEHCLPTQTGGDLLRRIGRIFILIKWGDQNSPFRRRLFIIGEKSGEFYCG